VIWTRNRYQVNLRFKSDVPYTLNYILLNSNHILLNYIPTWVLIKIKVSGAATIADQPRINRESTAIPTVSIVGGFCRMRHYFAQRIVKTLLHITVFIDMAWARAQSGGFNNRGAIADQPRTNGPIAAFIDIFWKLNRSGLLDFELCCSDSPLLLAITIEHSV